MPLSAQTVAGTEAFEAWFRQYLEKFRLGNVSSDEFRELYMSAFGDKPVAKEIDWQTWFFGKGAHAHHQHRFWDLTCCCTFVSMLCASKIAVHGRRYAAVGQ